MMKLLSILLLVPILGGGMATANRLYRAGEHRRAAALYAGRIAEGDSSAAARYNLGTALLRLGRHDDARPYLEAAAAAKRGIGRELKERAHYNAGNADLEPVFAARVPEDQREPRLKRAAAHYRNALLQDPSDADAKWNLELAMRLLQRERGGGGGGGDEDENPSGGGGEGDDPQQADPQPQPAPGAQGSGAPRLSREAAERLLSRAGEDERQVQREVLERNRGGREGVRDW